MSKEIENLGLTYESDLSSIEKYLLTHQFENAFQSKMNDVFKEQNILGDQGWLAQRLLTENENNLHKSNLNKIQ
jgi:hypothetical protein